MECTTLTKGQFLCLQKGVVLFEFNSPILKNGALISKKLKPILKDFEWISNLLVGKFKLITCSTPMHILSYIRSITQATMRPVYFLFLFIFATGIQITCAQPSGRTNFDAGWKFNLGDVQQAEQPSFPDNNWRSLDLPHDWSIEGAFSPDNPATNSGGSLPGGVGWYAKILWSLTLWQVLNFSSNLTAYI